MLKLICAVCGKEMEALKSTKKYCSRTCENIARNERVRLKKQLGIDKNEKQCLLCGNTFIPKTGAANQRLCCYDCMPDGHQLGRSEFLNLLREKRGGKCERCGYDTYLGALEFHHVNPSEKDFTVGDRDFKLKDCIEESKKCVMICSNCHREVHAGLWDVSEILKKEEVDLDSN